MKVALIVPGGVDRSGTHRVMPFFLALIERIARRHELHVIALFQEPTPSTYPLLGATVHNIGRGRTALRALSTLRREHARGGFDVLHAMWATPAGTLGAVASRVLRRPLLVHLLGGELVSLPEIGYGERRTLRGRARVRAALAGATRLTAQSEPIRAMARRLGFEAQRLPLGIDLGVWPPRPPHPRPSGRVGRLVHVASLNKVKDQTTLLAAMTLLAADRIPFHLDVVGEDTLSGRVQSLAQESGLGDVVRFHGFLEQAALRPIVEAADLLVMSSRHEAGPAVLMEAAAVGVPTVGTAVGQIAEWAPDAAIAVPCGDAGALATAVRAVLEDERRRLEMATLAQRRATLEDADWTANRVEWTYEEMLRE